MSSFTVIASGLAFPEGPAFAPDGALWGVELDGGALFRIDAHGLRRVDVGGRPNGLAFRREDLLFCDAGLDQVRCLSGARPEATPSVIAEWRDETPLTGPNDLAFDPVGRLVFTCPGDSRVEPTGTVWCQDRQGRLNRLADGMFFPNGLAFTPDGKDLIVAETFRQRLWRGSWDAVTGRWLRPRPWLDVGGPKGPDGMAFGPDGRLYVALYGQGCVVVVDLNDGIVERIGVPGSRPTNLAFDPTAQLGMVVTEADHGLLLSYPGVGTAPSGAAPL